MRFCSQLRSYWPLMAPGGGNVIFLWMWPLAGWPCWSRWPTLGGGGAALLGFSGWLFLKEGGWRRKRIMELGEECVGDICMGLEVIHTGILLSCKESAWCCDICRKMVGNWDYYTKWNKPDSERQHIFLSYVESRLCVCARECIGHETIQGTIRGKSSKGGGRIIGHTHRESRRREYLGCGRKALHDSEGWWVRMNKIKI